MAAENNCPHCESRQSADAMAGLCPHCLLRLGLGDDLSRAPGREDQPGRPDPRSAGGHHGLLRPVSGATPVFPVSGVLDALGEAIGPVPRVLLRDGSVDDHRPVKPRSTEMPDLADDTGRYQLIGEIARGGMGAILKGRDVDLGRDLAVKVILEEHRDHPEMIRRFVEEAQIGGQLQHPGIVPVHEIGRFSDGRLYIAMKLVRGRTLAALLESRQDPADDRPRFLSIFEQVCQTMAYAHSRGVIHRDLKPSNVMVGGFGEVQVMDWGLAKVLEQGGVVDEEKALRRRDDLSGIRTLRTGSDACDSRAGSVVGTPAYMAPEQARGALDTVDERADVFGLGSILCEILTGHPAYSGRTGAELYRKAERADLSDALTRLDACGADDELVALVRSCLSVAPKDRPREAGVILAGLTAYLAGVELRLRKAGLARAQAEGRADAERNRRVLTMALAASVLATALVVAGGWIWAVRDRADRVAKTAAEVNKALEEASLSRGQARSGACDPAMWAEASAAAKRAEALLDQNGEGGELRDRVQDLLTAIARDRATAEAAEKDRRLVERLIEIHSDFAVHLDQAQMDAQYVAAFRDIGVDVDALNPAEAGARIAARPDAGELLGALDQWIFARQRHDPAGARRLIAVSRAADPDPWRRRLRDALDSKDADKGQALAVLGQLAASPAVADLPGETMARLAWALSHLGDREKAISLLRIAQRAHPDDFWINFDLATTLRDLGRHDEAIRFFSVAVAVRPRSDFALDHLGTALYDAGRLEDAAATLHSAVRLRPDNAHIRVSLGGVLMDQGERGLAEAEFADARRLRPGDVMIRNRIAHIFMEKGDVDSAVAELREAVDQYPENACAHDALGAALWDTGRADEAVALFREAIRLDPRFAPAYSNLGRALLEQGEFDEAIESLRRGHYGPVGTDRRSPSAAILREAERMATLDLRLPALLRGADRPVDAAESAAFARLCFAKQLYAASARLWREAFAGRPSLADDPRGGHRHRAARAAALAGAGRGKDDPTPDANERGRWRRQALDWLRDDLAAYKQQLGAGPPSGRATAPRQLGLWRVDPALAGLRDEPALSALGESERQACRALWSEVDVLQARARKGARPAPPGRPF
jgi:Flp pilus assembly protein TadD